VQLTMEVGHNCEAGGGLDAIQREDAAVQQSHAMAAVGQGGLDQFNASWPWKSGNELDTRVAVAAGAFH